MTTFIQMSNLGTIIIRLFYVKIATSCSLYLLTGNVSSLFPVPQL